MFLSPLGLLALSFIDSSIFFFTPLASDLVVIILSARNPDRFWTYPALAVSGSVAGTVLTFWIGRKIGEAGLERFVSTPKLDRVKRRVKEKGAFAAGALALAPPPFPFTAMVLAAGALDVSFSRFIGTAAVMRGVRYGAEALLARRYGRAIIAWMESPIFEGVVIFFVAIAVAGTAYAVYQAARWRKGPRGK